MAPFFFLPHFPFITSIVFLIVTPTNGENTKYAACSTLYTCGKIQKVGYPFWGENRPKYCGITDFKLSCDDDKNTSFNFFENKDFGLNVKGINTSSHTIKFSLKTISKYCYLKKVSIVKTINSTFLLDSAYNKTVHLFYGCDSHCVSKFHSRKAFTCSTYGDGTKGTGYYFGEASEVSRIGNDCLCKNNVTVPVDKKVFDELKSTNASPLDILTRKLMIETKYKVNFNDHCVKCVHSGGRCGSSDNQSSDQFVCYCQDGPSSLVCHTTEEKKRKLILGLEAKKPLELIFGIGFCFEGKRRALIYDFMSNGSLEKFAYHGAAEQALPWETLFSIAVGIARGLEYLHRGCNARILHLDIKPHNILLDENFCPKISDFGLARLCPQQESTISMLEARGTIGYIAPEVIYRTIGGISNKSDVYSYGMMILDIVCGRKNLITADDMQRSSELYFPQWIYKRLQHGEEVAIQGIMNDEEKAIERKLILVSLWCIQTFPSNRPSMSRVIEMLLGDLELIQLPPTARMDLESEQLPTEARLDYISSETISLAQL